MLGIREADHEETEPDGSALVVTRLVCSLVGQTQPVQIEPGSLVHRAYGSTRTIEQFRCSFGLNPRYRDELTRGDLAVVGVGDDGEVRLAELCGHPFFVGTLFVPQLSSTATAPHPLIVAFLRAAKGIRDGRGVG